MKSPATRLAPFPVRAALKKLGGDIADARRRWRISTATMADRARISRPTLVRLERGNATVSMGILATVLFILGMQERLGDLADAKHDRADLDLEAEWFPKRIDGPRKKRVPTEKSHEP